MLSKANTDMMPLKSPRHKNIYTCVSGCGSVVDVFFFPAVVLWVCSAIDEFILRYLLQCAYHRKFKSPKKPFITILVLCSNSISFCFWKHRRRREKVVLQCKIMLDLTCYAFEVFIWSFFSFFIIWQWTFSFRYHTVDFLLTQILFVSSMSLLGWRNGMRT